MQGVTKFFDRVKGWGFIVDTENQNDVFIHHSSIKMNGFRYLDEDDIVNFEIGTGNNGREQAVDVTPILTKKMIEKSLKQEKLHVKTVADPHATCHLYMVVNDKDEPLSSEQGMNFIELAAFAGFDTEGLYA